MEFQKKMNLKNIFQSHSEGFKMWTWNRRKLGGEGGESKMRREKREHGDTKK